MSKKWYSVGISDVEKILRTNAACGLSNKAARSRIRKNGKNDFFYTESKSAFAYIRSLLSDPIMLLLIGVAFIAALFDEALVAIGVGAVILVHLVAVFVLYYTSYRKLTAISASCRPKVRVIRDGKLFITDSENIAVGDVLLLEKGDIIPCDARIVSSEQLKVNIFMGRKAKNTYLSTEPDPMSIYDEQSTKEFVEYRNMLYAGSIVLSGTGRCIVVETGKNTYIGILDGGIPINDSSEHPKILSDLKSFSKLYSLILLIAILPLTIIGIFSFGFDNMLGMFLLSLSVLISALCDLIYIIGNIITANVLFRSATSVNNRTLIKSAQQIDSLAKIDRLVLIGDSAFTGKKQLVICSFTNGKEYRGKEIFNKNIIRSAELAIAIIKAVNAYPSASVAKNVNIPNDFYDYARRLGVDFESIDMRYFVKSLNLGDIINASVTDGQSTYELCMAQGGKLLHMCFSENIGDEAVVISAERRKILEKSFFSAIQQGCRVYTIAKYVNGNYIFEGMFAFKRPINMNTRGAINKMKELGIKTEVFLQDPSSAFTVYEGGFVRGKTEIAYASKSAGIIPESEDFGAYIGYSYQEIKKHIVQLRKKGHKVALYDINATGYSLFEHSDICITADSVVKAFPKNDPVQTDSYVSSGNDLSDDGSQILRFSSDVAIPRAELKSGGTESILNAITAARSVIQNIIFAISYLLCSQISRVAFVVPSFIFGIESVKPIYLLIGGLWIDIAIIFVLSLTASGTISGTFRIPSLKNPFLLCKNELIRVGSASIVGSLCAIILVFITKIDVSAAVFASVCITQILMFLNIKRKICRKITVLGKYDIILISSICILLVLALIISAIGNTFSALSLICIPITPIIYLFMSIFFNRNRK